MDGSQFDALARSASRLRRRALVQALGAAVAVAAGGVVAGASDADAKRRARSEHNVRGAKAIMCVGGITKRVAKKRRKALIRQGATRGECAPVPGGCPTGQKACNGSCIATAACCTSADCVSPQICDSGVCVSTGPVSCITTADCPAGQGCVLCTCEDVACVSNGECTQVGSLGYCVMGACVFVSLLGPPCAQNADCLNLEAPYCDSGVCKPGCYGLPCTGSQICDLGVCTTCGAG
ncbi:MAG: hypothetical protein QM692_07370 [Thermomicrobiales bacterium]